MLTKVQTYSTWASAQALPLDSSGRAETDLIQVRNIAGLEPVKATINLSPYGSVDGGSMIGRRVDTRNIVLTLHPNPDWDIWTFTSLRKLLYKYFMPKSLVRLVFYSDDIPPVEIYGYVEDFGANIFSQDPEFVLSVLCPDPYFTSVDPIVITGITVAEIAALQEIVYDGDIETGFNLVVDYNTNPTTNVKLKMNSTLFDVDCSVNAAMRFEMNSIPGSKYVRNVNLSTGAIINLLSKVKDGYTWPTLIPGKNYVLISSDDVVGQTWTLTYFNRYGGL